MEEVDVLGDDGAEQAFELEPRGVLMTGVVYSTFSLRPGRQLPGLQ